MGAHDRRLAIWNTLCYRRQETVAHLAEEYHVSRRTIYYDIEVLSLIYPIEAIHGRYCGGIKIADWYNPRPNILSPAQIGLLKSLHKTLSGNDAIILLSIINQFAG